MTQGRRITLSQKQIYWDERGTGHTIIESATKAGFSESKAVTLERDRKSRLPLDERGRMTRQSDPLMPYELKPQAKRALEDFGYFQRRYFGRKAYHWQVEAATKVVELLASPHKEYLVVNCPPGSGKSTLFAHDIPAWLTVRNRQIRGMIGSSTTNLAAGYVDRLRRTLARTLPQKGRDDEIERGEAFDAETTLAADFGRFQAVGDMWTRDAFYVQQYDDMGAVSEKEPTWSGYGQDAGYIGQRFNFVIWDDLVDPKKQKTIEAKEALENYWDDVSEPRLEPAGLLVLQGQRFSTSDLYRYCLDKWVGEEIDFDTGEYLDRKPKYHHIKYKAHYDDLCNPHITHKRDAPAYPDGCLLSPERIPWREISSMMSNRADRFEVVFQQEDSDPASVLVPKAWIYGYDDHPGCMDEDRDRLELPKNADGSTALVGDLVSYMAVDPSPTRYWAIEWWVYQPAVEYRWLIDLERRPMEANEFLDFNHATGRFTGVLEEWFQTSTDLGIPISHVIVEDNAAQRFLLQYDMVHQWMARRSVEIIGHSTHRNKSDPELGVESIREHYKYGRKRLPGKRNSAGFVCSMRLVDELTTYPDGKTDDCVMADWFGEWNLPRIYSPQEADGKMWRPSWAGSVPDLKRKPGVESGAMAMMAARGVSVIDPETVVALYYQRRMKRQPMMDKRLKVLEQYNGETQVFMPELDLQQEPAIANLLGLGLDQFAQRIASVLPNIDYPSLRPGYGVWDEKARQSRLANLGWWDMNRMDLLEYKRARYLLAFSSTPVTIHPVSASASDKRNIPHWRIRSPLNTFPALPSDELDVEPSDYIVAHEYPLSWLEERYRAQTAVLYKGRQSQISRDMKFEVLEYNDADETVLVACGASKGERQSGDWQDTDIGSASSVLLARVPNKAGICNMVVPGRIVLDKPIGHFDTMLHLFTSQAKMAAYEELSMFRSIFPEQWVMSHPNAPTKPKITRDADGKQGIVGIVENGVIQSLNITPGAQVPTAIDRLERASRLAGGIPAEFGGEAASNIRTARRGGQVMGDTVDMPLQEYQQILASSHDAENLRAVRTMKAYYGKTTSMYVVPRDGKITAIPGNPATYVPDDIFVSDYSKASYPFLGSDASSIPIEIGQRVGTTEMSLQTARELDPKISDPIQENARVIGEGLDKALLGGIEQQLAGGMLDPIVAARIKQAMKADPTKDLADIYVKVHEQMQQEQAAAQAAAPPPAGAPGAVPGGPPPGAMPGAAVPPGGAQPQPLNPPPGQGTQNLAQMVSELGQGAKTPVPS